MKDVNKGAILAYILLLSVITLIIPAYGDPAIVIWTSRIMSVTGFPYDPVCSKNIAHTVNNHKEASSLCVRAPLYYSLLALADGSYRVVPLALTLLFLALQIVLASLNKSSLSVFGLMFPPIYLLFSRTYVDTLTIALMNALLIVLMKAKARNNEMRDHALLFSIPLLLALTRESSTALPLFLIIVFLIVRELEKRSLLIAFFGWVAGTAIWQLYVNISRGVSYSDFQPHIPTLGEIYRAFMSVATPILPWEIHSEDVRAYLNMPIGDALTLALIIAFHIMGVLAILPVMVSLISFKRVSKLILGQASFGLLASAGLLVLKGDIDFFRHLAYLLPAIPLTVENGLKEIEKASRLAANLVKLSYVMMFNAYLVRTIRLYVSGYSFDPCQYLLKRSEISSISYFYETACA